MLPRTLNGNRFIIVATCYMTKYVITAAVENVTAKDIADFLLHRIILNFSCIETLITDNGVQFTSDLIKELNRLMKTNHNFTTPYNPTTAGCVERCNQQIIQLIRCYVENIVHDWDNVLPFISFIYNTSFHSSTK
ncbi:pol polyprotein-like protein, partial [Leptotrombidium deliense]